MSELVHWVAALLLAEAGRLSVDDRTVTDTTVSLLGNLDQLLKASQCCHAVNVCPPHEFLVQHVQFAIGAISDHETTLSTTLGEC